ncbi:hypothetical protein U9M48_026564 [Paspalum notatum var. saurae]|uniref:Uncharacterized protein n=1 Tax=Paspalum notatum var. saurae TaxID=547442 RepID=A0AAQ3TSP0_PASNO
MCDCTSRGEPVVAECDDAGSAEEGEHAPGPPPRRRADLPGRGAERPRALRARHLAAAGSDAARGSSDRSSRQRRRRPPRQLLRDEKERDCASAGAGGGGDLRGGPPSRRRGAR